MLPRVVVLFIKKNLAWYNFRRHEQQGGRINGEVA